MKDPVDGQELDKYDTCRNKQQKKGIRRMKTFKAHITEVSDTPTIKIGNRVYNGDIRGSHFIVDNDVEVGKSSYTGSPKSIADIVELPKGIKTWEVDNDYRVTYDDSLQSLKGGPTKVKGFHVYKCSKLRSLKDGPSECRGDLVVEVNPKLSSLEGSPQDVRNFYCDDNNSLKTLEGGPKTVKGNFWCRWNKSLSTLKGAPSSISRIRDGLGIIENPKLSEDEINTFINKHK